MSRFNQSLARRMTTLILIGTGLVLSLVLGSSYILQRQWILPAAMQQDAILSQSVLYRIDEQLAGPRAVANQTALLLGSEFYRWSRDEIPALIHKTLAANPGIEGMALALAPEVAGRKNFEIVYGWRDGQSISVHERLTPEQDYQHDWFYLPYHLKTPQWIDPYYDPDAQALMVTYSVPVLIYGKVVAVITCDLSLEKIRQMLDELPLGDGGIAVLLSRWGTFISHPNRDLEMKETIFSLADSQKNPEQRALLRELGQRMVNGEIGHMEYQRPNEGDVAFIHYASIPSVDWSLGIIRSKSQVLAPLFRLNRLSAVIGFAGIVLLLIPAIAIAVSVARPLRRLADTAGQLAVGDFEAPLPKMRSRDEVFQLTESFARMRNDLRRYIDDLTETTATRERIASELSIAREIQLGIVPKLFPAFPDRKDIDLYAVLMPAREVGGDLYDFGLLDDDHLYIAIGDVSGKGVPASLLMAVGKTLLKSTICNLRDPGSALAEVNDEIGADNETCMFITLFCGILNLKTGEFIYANGGHNPPFLVRSAESAEMTGTPSGPALGIIPGSAYTNQSLSMAPGDVLVLYTDGITEAMNPANELYGEDRLSDHIRERFESPAIEIIDGLSRSVNDFADGAEQSDDITALVVRFLGRETQEAEETSSETGSCKTAALSPQSILSLSNRIAELDRLVSWIEDQGKVYSLSASVITDLNLALEEWIVNVISHAFEDEASRWIKLRWWYSKEEIRIEIEDDGKPFDPTLPKPVDISIPLDERPIGGMGIRFIQKRMDGFLYRREDNRNIVTLVKALNGCENSIR